MKFDPFLLEADEDLINIYKQYASGSYKSPIKIKIIDEDNFGIEALEPIPKLTLIGEYAADIIPAVHCTKSKWKEHIMIYYQGPTSEEDLMLVPFNICNFGPLLNHSSAANCSSLRIII